MGLQIIKPDTRIDFIGFRKIAYLISALLILAGVVSLAYHGGPKYGIDFEGGMIVQVKTDHHVTPGDLKNSLAQANLPGLVVQSFGLEGDNEYLIRTSSSEISSQEVRKTVSQAFTDNLKDVTVDIQRLEMVGPKVGSDLRAQALEALLFAVLFIAIYISWRFEQRLMAAAVMAASLGAGWWVLNLLGLNMTYVIPALLLISMILCWYIKLNYALGAVVALVHDVFITVGVFSLLGKEFDLTIIAALLTIIGYSLNDTIIVFDRIRENNIANKGLNLAGTINRSVNQTLSRTIMTSFTTLMVVICLFVLGGSVIHDFALALIIGIGIGTYSSIFVASPILLGFGASPVPEEEA